MGPQLRLGIEAPAAVHAFHLFHDEAGFHRGSRYGTHAILAVPERLVAPLGRALARARADTGYEHEIHFKKVGSTNWRNSAEWQLAHRWLDIFFANGLTGVKFKAFSVDMHHEEFDRGRYPNATAAYRRFAISAAKALVAWCFHSMGEVELIPFTDAGNQSALKLRRDGDLFDKFHVYVQREVERGKREKPGVRYPTIRFQTPLRAISSSPSKVSRIEASALGLTEEELRVRCDLVQLTDLVCSALHAGLELKATNEGKQALADRAASQLAEVYELPWHRAEVRARSFSLSMFPGPDRTPYAISLKSIKAAGIAGVKGDSRLLERYERRYGIRADYVTPPTRRLIVA